MNLVDDKDSQFFREKLKHHPWRSQKKILLKIPWTLVFKKVGEFEQFPGAEHRLKGPFLFTGPEVPDLTPQ